MTRKRSWMPLAAALLCAAPAAAQDEPAAPRRPPSTSRVIAEAGYARSSQEGASGHTVSLGLLRRGPAGAVLGRVTQARRFGDSGYQAELEVYPRLGPRAYAYAAAGVGTRGTFPLLRYAGEVFAGFGPGWEVSAGMRGMEYGARSVQLYTGSMGRYFGNWWSMGRVYVSPAYADNDVTVEAALRRYYADGDNWVGGRVSYGTTPREDAAEDEVSRVEAVRARLEASRSLSPATIATFALGLEREDLSPARPRSRVELTLGLQRALKE